MKGEPTTVCNPSFSAGSKSLSFRPADLASFRPVCDSEKSSKKTEGPHWPFGGNSISTAGLTQDFGRSRFQRETRQKTDQAAFVAVSKTHSDWVYPLAIEGRETKPGGPSFSLRKPHME
jgi:hypothetical protein